MHFEGFNEALEKSKTKVQAELTSRYQNASTFGNASEICIDLRH